MEEHSVWPGSVSVMGVNVVPFDSYEHALQCIERKITSGVQCFCVAINPEKVYRSGQDAELRRVLETADMGICDGIGVAIAGWLLYGRRLRRCTGVDLFLHLMARAAERGWGVFLLGASPESNSAACDRLVSMYPGLRIVGRQDGYFADSSDVVRAINASGAELLFVALGSPRQELWITKHRSDLRALFCMGVGGTLDVISGKARRAPGLFRRTGTEFLFRLICEPARWRRQIVLPLFLLSVLKQRLFGTR